MRSSTKTIALMLSSSLLMLSACSKAPDDSKAPAQESATTTIDVAPSAKDAGAGVAAQSGPKAAAADEAAAPGISSEVAPGVAFAYRYAFTLPADAISGMQRQHSDACLKLGPTRCKVTGMNYSQPREGTVSAQLDFLLAPDIAQQFGSDAVGLVEKAEGSLANAEVNGENAGAAIAISQQSSAAMQAELARLEARLKAPGMSQEERAELNQRVDNLNNQLSGEKTLRDQKEASIATTPVSFAYGSEGLFNAGKNPFGAAASSSLDSLEKMAAFVLALAGMLLPWALLIGLVVLVVRMRMMKAKLNGLTAGSPNAAVAAEPAAQ